MPGGRDPVAHDPLELLGGVAGMRGGHEIEEAAFPAAHHGFGVAFGHALERLLLCPVRMLRGQCLDPIEREEELKIQRLLRPERAVVVERGDPFRWR